VRSPTFRGESDQLSQRKIPLPVEPGWNKILDENHQNYGSVQNTYISINITSSDRKKWCITINHVKSSSNLGNGMVQMPILGKIDIYGVKKRLMRYI